MRSAESLRTEEGISAAYAAHGAELYRFALRALGDTGAAQDVVQETFLRAWRAADRFDPELASLRVLGFTRTEVSGLLLGEMAIGIAIALPVGMALGYGLVQLVSRLVSSDQFLFPVVIQPATYAWAGIAVLISGVASALVVRRRIDKLDMVAALKTRE